MIYNSIIDKIKFAKSAFYFLPKAKKSTLVLDNTISKYIAEWAKQEFYLFADRAAPVVISSYLKSYKINSLNLHNMDVSDIHMHKIAKIMEYNSQISNLDFSNNKLGSNSGIKELFINLKGNPSVNYLNLANNNIGDYDTYAISTNLKYNNIAYLNLENNKLTEYGIGIIIRGLKDSNIISLKFGDVQIQDEEDIECITKNLLEYQFITEITLSSLNTDFMQKINSHIEHNKQTLCNAQKIVKVFKEHLNIKEVNIQQLFDKEDLKAFKLYSDRSWKNEYSMELG